jgi:hypothetical protein
VILAWRIRADEVTRKRAMSTAVFSMCLADEEGNVTETMVTPAELLATSLEDTGFGLDAQDDGAWTFACAMHDDAWDNGDPDDLVRRLAALGAGAEGVVIAARAWQSRLSEAWIVERGSMREVEALPAIPFDPGGTEREAMRAVRSACEACSTVRSPARPRPAELASSVRQLVHEAWPAFGTVSTPDAFCYGFAELPGLELRFAPLETGVAPTLHHGEHTAKLGWERLRHVELESDFRSFAGELRVEAPFFLLEVGAAVKPEFLVAAVTEHRWKLERVARCPHTTAEQITAIADVLLAGAYDDLARETLIGLVSHANSPAELAQRLRGHTSRSIREACAQRLSRR